MINRLIELSKEFPEVLWEKPPGRWWRVTADGILNISEDKDGAIPWGNIKLDTLQQMLSDNEVHLVKDKFMPKEEAEKLWKEFGKLRRGRSNIKTFEGEVIEIHPALAHEERALYREAFPEPPLSGGNGTQNGIDDDVPF